MGKVRILLADDHLSVLDVVASVLEPTFEIVGRVADGQALVEAAAKLQPDVILTDISMPVLNGIDATRRLKESDSKSRVVFLTVHKDPDFIQACFEAGALGYVFKPRMVTDLLRAVQEAFVGRGFVSPISTGEPG